MILWKRCLTRGSGQSHCSKTDPKQQSRVIEASLNNNQSYQRGSKTPQFLRVVLWLEILHGDEQTTRRKDEGPTSLTTTDKCVCSISDDIRRWSCDWNRIAELQKRGYWKQSKRRVVYGLSGHVFLFLPVSRHDEKQLILFRLPSPNGDVVLIWPSACRRAKCCSIVIESTVGTCGDHDVKISVSLKWTDAPRVYQRMN